MGLFDALTGKKEQEKKSSVQVTSGKELKELVYYSGDNGKNAKELIAPDGANTAPLNYMTVNDGGRDVYYVGFFMERNLMSTTIAVEYKSLFDFRGISAAVYVHPLNEQSSRLVNRRVSMLESERLAANDINRTREIQLKLADVQELAAMIDSGAEKLYEAYFYFLLKRDSLELLKQDAAVFVSLAASMNITLRSTYAATPETFWSMLPTNKMYQVKPGVGVVEMNPFKKSIMTTASLSTIYPHTSSEYFHSEGALLGEFMSTGMPFVFDLYDESHFSYGMIIAGETGYGKSASEKIKDLRFINRGYSIVSIDYQLNGRAGEYAIPCESCGGVNYVIGDSTGNGVRLNLFEIAEDHDRDPDTGIITETLRLNEKKEQLTNILLSIAMASTVEDRAAYEAADVDYMSEIIGDCIAAVYKKIGLVDGDPSTLYTTEKMPGKINSNRVKKALPRMKDFYLELLRADSANNASEDGELKKKVYAILKGKFKNWVRKLYYCPVCFREFDEEEYEALSDITDENDKVIGKGHLHKVKMQDGTTSEQLARVIEIEGSSAYFDYPSTITLEDNLPWYNFDLSQAPESVRPVLVLVAMNYIMENMIKRNSVDPTQAKKMVFVTDEFHKVMKSMTKGVIKAYVALYRTARKHFVGPVIITQSVNDIAKHEEAKEIMDSTAVYMLFRHLFDATDCLKNDLGLTDAAVEGIMNLGGDKDHKIHGQCCVYDRATNQTSFVRFKYFSETEGYMIETDTRKRAELMAKLGITE